MYTVKWKKKFFELFRVSWNGLLQAEGQLDRRKVRVFLTKADVFTKLDYNLIVGYVVDAVESLAKHATPH